MDGSIARDMLGVAIAVFAVVSLIAVIAPASAPVTRAISGFYHLGFGLGGYVLPFAILGVAALVFIRDEVSLRARTGVGLALAFVSIISLLALVLTPDSMVLGVTVREDDLVRSGGYLGFWIASALAGLFGKPIAGVLLVGVLVAAAILVGFSVTGFTEGVRRRVGAVRERRQVAVNERPWGDDAPADEPVRSDRKGFSRRFQQEELDLDDSFGSNVTTLIDDQPDVDEDPFVDLSEQLAAEHAETTLIAPPQPVAPKRSAGSRKKRASAATSSAPFTDEDLPPFDLESDTDEGGSAKTRLIDRGASAAEPPIPDFLLRSKEANGAASPKVDAVPSDSPSAATQAVPPRADSDSSAPEGEGSGERQLPPLSMLRHNPQSANSASSENELAQTAESLQSTLQEFNLHSRVVGWISGPTVTTFKVQPGEGERVSRISSLEDDIALALAAQSVRIFAPIPGTSLVGIEIPNRKRQTVNLGDVLPYVQGGPLELAIGRDAEGSPIVADLAKMPHLLIAGTTGSGKSVMINTIVTTLLMRTVPEDVRLIMVDPKRVELAGYNGLPHLYVPVVTEPKQAASALQWAVSEMERRLKVFEKVSVRKISTFNEKQAAGAFEHYDNPPQKMPYLVIIIDELSDLMMVAGKDVEASIVRIAQLGRAAGIHLIVATQRPSSNVVTGLIKANITNRIAFNVATGIDSRVIIDQMGAEKLTGLGDMLFSKVDWGKPKRIQGCFVSDEEIASIVDFVKSQGEADYHEEILSAVAPAMMSGSGGGHEASDDDPLVWEAAHVVVESQLGSTSGLQRRLKVGYARAGRIMDMLEEKGVVGPPDGSKPREVLLDEEGLAELEALEARMSQDDDLGGF